MTRERHKNQTNIKEQIKYRKNRESKIYISVDKAVKIQTWEKTKYVLLSAIVPMHYQKRETQSKTKR